jgi:hypothetical protein
MGLLGIAGAMVGATPTSAAPVLSSTTAVKAAVADNVVDVRWRRGSGIAAGIAAGALAGAVIGAAVSKAGTARLHGTLGSAIR